MRNPWADKFYSGPWNDTDTNWTDALRQELGFNNTTENGIFWMPYDDYIKTFDSTEVAYYDKYEGYESYNLKLKSEDDFNVPYAIEIPVD